MNELKSNVNNDAWKRINDNKIILIPFFMDAKSISSYLCNHHKYRICRKIFPVSIIVYNDYNFLKGEIL